MPEKSSQPEAQQAGGSAPQHQQSTTSEPETHYAKNKANVQTRHPDDMAQSDTPSVCAQDYEILSEIGKGGMGVIYKARHKILNDLVAIKMIAPHHQTKHQEQALARFYREMRALAQVKHRNVVQVRDARVENGTYYFVMELLEGLSLRALVESRGALPASQACEVARQAAEGLDAIHRRQLVHRDVKPDNLFWTRQGVVKLLDLGLVRSAAGSEEHSADRLTGAGFLMGTADFIAPEQVRDAAGVTPQADLYSLGCTLYYLLTGRAPYAHLAWIARPGAHGDPREKPASIEKLCPKCPKEVIRMVERMMAPDLKQRYGSARAVAEDLHQWQSQTSTTTETQPLSSSSALTSPSPAESQTAAKPTRRRTWIVLLSCGAALGAVALIAWAALSDGAKVKVATPKGTLVLEFPDGIPKTAEVLVDGDRVTLKGIDRNKGELQITVGNRKVEVRDGDRIYRNEEVKITTQERLVLTVRFVPKTIARLDARTTPFDDGEPGQIASLSGHTSYPSCVAFSADGLSALSGQMHTLARPGFWYWDLNKRRAIASWQHGVVPRAIAVSTKGKQFVSGHNLFSSTKADGTAVFWDLARKKAAGSLLHKGSVTCVALSSDEKYLASGTDKGLVYVWDVSTGKAYRTFEHSAAVNSVAFSPDDQLVLSGSEDKSARVWNVRQDRQEQSFEEHKTGVKAVTFSRDGERALTLSRDDLFAATVYTWDVSNGKVIRKVEDNDKQAGQITAEALSGSAGLALVGRYYGKITLLDLKTGTANVWSDTKHKGQVTCLGFSANGRLALSGGRDKTIRFWRLPKRKTKE